MQQTGFDPERLARVTGAMQRFVESGDVAGIVTLTWRRGEIAQADALGWRDLETRSPMTRDTLFRIASMTKPVTSAAALMLVEDGLLDFQSPVSAWLPELANVAVLTSPDAPLEHTEPLRAPITLLDLLTHRAGFAYHFTAEGALADAYERVFNGFDMMVDPGRWLEHVAELPLMFQPRTRWHYGIATDVLGALIQRVAGMPLGEFFRTRIFEPLGMHDTGFIVTADKTGRLSTSYAFDAANRQLVVEDHPASSRWINAARFQSGGGGLVSTADDYLRFARLLLGRGRLQGDAAERTQGPRLLSHKSVDLMRSNFLTAEERRIPAFGYPVWESQGFGLGLAIIDDPARQQSAGYRSAGSFGWPGALGTSWFADPVEDMIGLLMIQRRSEDPFPLAREYERILYDAIDD
ncbi:CubicO group peptidase (beta-lactamase class C family) [Paraburkholderia sp. BL8N3]|jgi:CubicO group peptidase (beta-lactamase class C family)|nr:serine hydrolase domain-containing protein [Paraburkholderia sp. BL8N3]TCK38526.1 CubicO group peptidase (beta-lactamase class C family) [Paraburkholderia sp. BL8N3]